MTSGRCAATDEEDFTSDPCSRYSSHRHGPGPRRMPARLRPGVVARRLLGHADISTTQRYMHLDDRELAEAQDLVE